MKQSGVSAITRVALLLASSLLLAAGTATVSAAPETHSGSDPLELPAMKSARAAKAMLLAVTPAGSRLVAVGEHGVIVYSDDQGKNWNQADVPVSVTLTAVQFTDAKHGWAVGHDGVVLSSADGGQSWVKRFDGNQANKLMLADLKKSAEEAHRAADEAKGAAKQAAQTAQEAADNAVGDVEAGAKFGPSRPLLGVYFKNANEGFVVGSYGQAFHTADGGGTWESLAGRLHNLEGLHYNIVTVTAGGSLVIAGEGGKVYRSRDNGATWQTLDTGYKGQLYGVMGLPAEGSAEALLVFGFGGHMLMGSKDGTSWQELPAVTHKNLVGGVQLANGSVLLASQDGSLLRSDDGGHGFTLLRQAADLEIAGLAQAENGAQIALAGVGGVHFVAAADAGKVK